MHRTSYSSGDSGDGFNQLIKSSPADATKLVQAFAEPLFKGFGVGLNSGWNNTAKTKKFLHLDIRITANLCPGTYLSDQTFDVTKDWLISFSFNARCFITYTILPRPFGGDKKCSTANNGYYIMITEHKITSFTMPQAIIQYIPCTRYTGLL